MNHFVYRLAALINEGELDIPRADADSTTVQEGMSILFGVASAVALLIVVILALRMVIARGNPQDFAKARDGIIYASIGLVICLTAFTIVSFVLNSV